VGVARIDHYLDPDAPAANSIVVAVTAVVLDEFGRLLLIRRSDNDLYAIPGGALELGETLTQAVRREVMEETGIAVEVAGLVGVYSDPAHVIEFSDGEVRQEFSVCFRADPVGGELRTSSESTEVLWVAPAGLDELEIHPSIRLRILHGLANRAEPYYS
jgi:ADP-ribose pyrophosphatase YjhB (NUDIX family)